jgi:aryl-alcohol dehydrogenase-like predicted oxidoreductase
MIPTALLPGTTRPTTAIGFGCNALLGPKSRREGLALLGEAFDAGVRHFDVARAYSSGDAEGLLGEFLDGRRDLVTITTKFGLQPPSGGLSRMTWLKSTARGLMRLSPGLRKKLGAYSGRRVEQNAFSVDQARSSLETSLRELRTDHVEILLLHEANASHCSPELAAYLAGETSAGRIGRFGVGSRFDRLREIARDRPDFAGVLQFENSAIHRNREVLAPPPTTFTITHGAIGSSLSTLRAFLDARPDVARRWSDDLGLDLTDGTNTLAPLLLAYAQHANPGGIVLFSSTRREAVKENLRAIADRRFPPDLLDRFNVLSREVDTRTGLLDGS